MEILSSIYYCVSPLPSSKMEDGSGEFAVGLLKELARAYLTATSSDNTGYKIWNEIPSELQEVLKPHFNSRLVKWTIPHTYYNLDCYIFLLLGTLHRSH